nr:MAG TPA: hypothetical protein [Caudoviricetes sp.]
MQANAVKSSRCRSSARNTMPEAVLYGQPIYSPSNTFPTQILISFRFIGFHLVTLFHFRLFNKRLASHAFWICAKPSLVIHLAMAKETSFHLNRSSLFCVFCNQFFSFSFEVIVVVLIFYGFCFRHFCFDITDFSSIFRIKSCECCLALLILCWFRPSLIFPIFIQQISLKCFVIGQSVLHDMDFIRIFCLRFGLQFFHRVTMYTGHIRGYSFTRCVIDRQIGECGVSG